jgi:hypothetical protein
MSKAFTVACPHCHVPVGTRCKYPNGEVRASHAGRIHAYLKTLKDVEDPEEGDSTNTDGNTPQTVNIG